MRLALSLCPICGRYYQGSKCEHGYGIENVPIVAIAAKVTAPPQPGDAERLADYDASTSGGCIVVGEHKVCWGPFLRRLLGAAQSALRLAQECEAAFHDEARQAQSALAESRRDNKKLDRAVTEWCEKHRVAVAERDESRAQVARLKLGLADFARTLKAATEDDHRLVAELAESRAEAGRLRAVVNARRGFSSPGFEQGQRSEWDAATEALNAAARAQGRREGMREAAQIAANTKYDRRGVPDSWAYACDVVSGAINAAAGVSNSLAAPEPQEERPR